MAIFLKNSVYDGEQTKRFILTKEQLKTHIQSGSSVYKNVLNLVPDDWWLKAYRVKENGGHLPARISSICQTIRDMLKMGNSEVEDITNIKTYGADVVDEKMLFSPIQISTQFWMISHYIADAHMPFHCDNRALASTTRQKTHGKIEDEWGKQIPDLFHSDNILNVEDDEILEVKFSNLSEFSEIHTGNTIYNLKNNGDPWKEAVYICRSSFAASYALVPPGIAPVDNQAKKVSFDDILSEKFCGKDLFWNISKSIMQDSISAIAMFWLDSWKDFVKPR